MYKPINRVISRNKLNKTQLEKKAINIVGDLEIPKDIYDKLNNPNAPYDEGYSNMEFAEKYEEYIEKFSEREIEEAKKKIKERADHILWELYELQTFIYKIRTGEKPYTYYKEEDLYAPNYTYFDKADTIIHKTVFELMGIGDLD